MAWGQREGGGVDMVDFEGILDLSAFFFEKGAVDWLSFFGANFEVHCWCVFMVILILSWLLTKMLYL